MGIQKMLAMPGVFNFSFISAMILSHVMPGRHCSGGLSETTVSNIESGAGSVAVSAWPALPKTRSTSGNAAQQAVLDLQNARGFVNGHPGHGGRHEKNRAFVQRRHEFRAEFLKWIEGRSPKSPTPPEW